MKAEDTVSADDTIHDSKQGLSWFTLINDCLKEEMVKPGDIEQYLLDLLLDNRKTQAEISFKAGIKEVVDWIRENSYTSVSDGFMEGGSGKRTFGNTHWQAKLKEWGINSV